MPTDWRVWVACGAVALAGVVPLLCRCLSRWLEEAIQHRARQNLARRYEQAGVRYPHLRAFMETRKPK